MPAGGPAIEAQTQTAAAGLIGGRYEVLDRVARGGQGEVVRARDRITGDEVALKIRPSGTDEAHEWAMMRGLRPHPSLPVVRDTLVEGDRAVLVTEWIDGDNLSRLLRVHGRM